ncbi:hypothetical protein AB0B25_09050 [Nocardia sp. NPDC049190]|uniref:hypothetical protein n=1 Tax=Nocardia sp. NPDC049190 TaxID=3155650 RepID=UPI0033E9FCA3
MDTHGTDVPIELRQGQLRFPVAPTPLFIDSADTGHTPSNLQLPTPGFDTA